MLTALAETFAINNRINRYLLNAIEETNLRDILQGNKGRNVGEQFAHIHNVRLMWLKAAMPEVMDHLIKVEEDITKEVLASRLEESSIGIIKLLEQAEVTGKVKGFKPHATAFLGYLLAHEAHHRGQIMLLLKQNGHLPDKKIQYGLWEWGVR